LAPAFAVPSACAAALPWALIGHAGSSMMAAATGIRRLLAAHSDFRLSAAHRVGWITKTEDINLVTMVAIGATRATTRADAAYCRHHPPGSRHPATSRWVGD
jgi:hypothetical protein